MEYINKKSAVLIGLFIIIAIISCGCSFDNITTKAILEISSGIDSVTLDSPADNAWLNQSIIAFSCTAHSSEPIASLKLFHNIGQEFGINNSNTSDVTSGVSYTFPAVYAADGAYEWNCLASNGTSFSFAPASRTLYVDTIPPAISLNSPAEGLITSNGSLIFGWTAIDNLDASMVCRLILDNKDNATGIAAVNNSEAVHLIPHIPMGTHLWQVYCIDEAGNGGSSEERTFTITDTPLVNLAPANGTNVMSKKLSFAISISSSENGTIRVNYDGTNMTLCSSCSSASITANATDFGARTIKAYASGFSGQEKEAKSEIWLTLDSDGDGTADPLEDDDDNDGLADSIDFLTGNNSNLNTNIPGLFFAVNGNTMLEGEYNTTAEISFNDSYASYARMQYAFAVPLVMGNISIYKQDSFSSAGAILIRGIPAQSKTIYVDNVDTAAARNHVCAKGIEISSLSDISPGCSGAGEYYVPCNGTVIAGIACALLGSRYAVTGNVFAAREQCSENWSIGDWGSCSDGSKTRAVADTSGCGTTFYKPADSQSCASSEEESAASEQDAVMQNLTTRPNVESQTSHLFAFISPTTPAYMRISDDAFPIKQIVIFAKYQAENVRISVQNLKGKPSDVNGLDGTVYKYIDISATNMPDSKVKSIKLTFSVASSWFKENNLSKSRVFLYRYSSEAWEKLETEQIGDKGYESIYEAESKGFSHFAIAAEKDPEGIKIKLGEQTPREATPTKQGAPIAGSEEQKKTGLSKITGSFKNSIEGTTPLYIILVIVVTATIVSGIFAFKSGKKNEKVDKPKRLVMNALRNGLDAPARAKGKPIPEAPEPPKKPTNGR